MARDFTAKCKRCRRAGEKLFLKGDRCQTPKCAIVRKPYKPGMHGSKSTKKNSSEFGQQLAMKQKIKRIYDVLERQFKKYFKEVRSKQGVTGDLLLQKLEMRLDNVIYRSGFAVNRRKARQLVNHSYFSVNGKRMNIPSYEVRVGDRIEVKSSKKGKAYFKQLEEIIKGRKGETASKWIAVDPGTMALEIKNKPGKDDMNLDVDVQMVVEYYSR